MKRTRVRKAPLWLRITGLVLGVALLLWLPIEDESEITVILFAAAICAWFAVRILRRYSSTENRFTLRSLLVGALSGLAVTPVALLLILFKTGLHGHGTLDYTREQILSLIWRTPLWVMSGLLLGLGVGLWFNSQDDSP